MSIHTVIERIKARPGMYLGRESLTALSMFICGYKAAEYDYAIKETEKQGLLPLGYDMMNGYADFIFGNKLSLGFCSVILKACGGDEKRAFKKFFEMYDELTGADINRYWVTKLTVENIEEWNSRYYYLNHGEKNPVLEKPETVYIIELSLNAYLIAVNTESGLIMLDSQFFGSFDDAICSHYIKSFGNPDDWKEVSGGDIFICENTCEKADKD